ncbi:MAG: hypothetical protein SGI74_14490 [Oligoflexia bacterium]|nr:hypothetical protein [Oligoflexia bacterium]
MLQFESVFWGTKNSLQLIKKLKALGFSTLPSTRDPGAQSIYFGPESIEIFDSQQTLLTLGDQQQLNEHLKSGDAIIGLGLESDNIARDYHRLKTVYPLEKLRSAKDTQKNVPLWYGFTVPDTTLGLNTWVLMNSPQVLQQQASEMLPLKHPNTCFGIEGIHILIKDFESASAKWSQVLEKQNSGIQWAELGKTHGKRLQAGDRFLDLLEKTNDTDLTRAANGREGVAMLTLKVADLEQAKALALASGASVINCNNRDGFIIPSEFTGGPALRIIRAFWKRYLPVLNDFFPQGRRPDKFRPLGGVNTTTLTDDFSDNWKY